MAMTFYGCKHNQNPIILKENEFEKNLDKWNLYKELFGFKKEDDVKEIKINIDTIEYYK